MLDTQLTMVGNINTDRPFYIIRQNDTKFLVKFINFIIDCFLSKEKSICFIKMGEKKEGANSFDWRIWM